MILKYSKSTYLLLFFSICFKLVSCAQQSTKKAQPEKKTPKILKTGANRTELYLDLLKNKNVAIVANQTSTIEILQRKEISTNVMGSEKVSKHLVDYLHSNKNINVQRVFAPEHGFRGKADAGETVKDGVDTKTGLSIISLYGKNKKPYPEQLKDIDVVVFDIQDVGARFYTYISTLHYVMEACAEAKIPVILLDRPNPNGYYIDGPVLEMKHKSFVGMHPVPIVYGMTIGEYGKMINGEHWLENGIQCDLTVVPLENYTHDTKYSLPIKPSPNLPNDISINLYPSLCFFEGTNVSVGRGTSEQFQIVGSPFYNLDRYTHEFTPVPNEGAKYPKHKDKICYGYDLRDVKALDKIDLTWLIDFYNGHKNHSKEKEFFNTFFVKLAGTERLKEQIKKGLTSDEIRSSWKQKIKEFQLKREKYLLYE
ncbi:exo-beta-N-acetylmuramidase NamZ family protein [Tenacibaculum xiamenense]|uniref:exo-beta-N-acetylmuramidase NamZ family protein n=1 Tax=Tenacibaculum xiamenense TaxID=1261553 RepID=UPI0038967D1D